MRRLGPILLVLAGCGAPDSPGHPGIAWQSGTERDALTVCAPGPTLEGLDVSHYDGAIDWARVAASGRAFGIAKATEGLTFSDPTFAANWDGMKAAGLIRGGYHFFHPTSSGAAQADWFLSKIPAFAAGDLPPILDWEAADGATNATAANEVQAFVARVRARTGLTTIVYTSARFLGTVGNPTQFSALPLWDAMWNVSCPNIPNAWQSWAFWQYSATATVPGISGQVDVNRFNGTLAQLQALTGAGETGAPDGGSDPDAGSPDGGAPPDAGADGDAGSPPDAGPQPDAGQLADAGTHPDAGQDGGQGEVLLPVGGCTSAGAPGAVLCLLALAARRKRRLPA